MIKTKIILKVIFSVLGVLLGFAAFLKGLFLATEYCPIIINIIGGVSLLFFLISLSWLFYEKYSEDVKKQSNGSKV